jgi:hypothetical protein
MVAYMKLKNDGDLTFKDLKILRIIWSLVARKDCELEDALRSGHPMLVVLFLK